MDHQQQLNLITSMGHVYSFLLTEISREPNAEPDLKVFVERKDESTLSGTLACRILEYQPMIGSPNRDPLMKRRTMDVTPPR